jgi:hypothetical protein
MKTGEFVINKKHFNICSRVKKFKKAGPKRIRRINCALHINTLQAPGLEWEVILTPIYAKNRGADLGHLM